MKHLSQFIRESLNGVSIDAEQIYSLYTKEIDVKTFAINCGITKKEAERFASVLDEEHLTIVSSSEIKDKYEKSETKDVFSDLDKLVDLGERVGADLGLTEKESKDRAELAGKDVDPDINIVNNVLKDFVGVRPNAIGTWFWKRSGTTAYLFFITSDDETLNNLIARI